MVSTVISNSHAASAIFLHSNFTCLRIVALTSGSILWNVLGIRRKNNEVGDTRIYEYSIQRYFFTKMIEK
jgi:hypothetical protein